MMSELLLEKEAVDCLFCHRRNAEKLYPALLNVVRCRECGLIYADPRLRQEEVLKLYSREYFENHSSETMGYDNYVSDRHLVEKTFRKRLQQLEKKWLVQKGRVLDV